MSSLASATSSLGSLNGLIIFFIAFSSTPVLTLTLVVIIFSGFSFATFSISIPPASLEIKAIFELDRSTKQDK